MHEHDCVATSCAQKPTRGFTTHVLGISATGVVRGVEERLLIPNPACYRPVPLHATAQCPCILQPSAPACYSPVPLHTTAQCSCMLQPSAPACYSPVPLQISGRNKPSCCCLHIVLLCNTSGRSPSYDRWAGTVQYE